MVRLQSDLELENTQGKLRMLEAEYESALNRPAPNAAARQATLRSLGRLIKQLKEEIAEFEAHQPTTS